MRPMLMGMLTVAALAVPATAQERLTHGASGASLPVAFEGQRMVEQKDLGTANDSVVNYEAPAGIESMTVYIFKAAAPSARIWFDRALPTVAQQIPMAIFDAGPIDRVATMGSTTPNALRQIFVARQAGPFKTTALLVAQSGPWIVKVRATSSTLDRVGLAARLDRHLAAMRITATKAAARLDAPTPCPATPAPGAGAAKPASGGTEAAAVAALVVLTRSFNPEAGYCRMDAPNARFTLLGIAGQPTSWLMLTGDAGKAFGVEPIDPGKPAGRHLVYVATPAGVRGAGVFDGAPSPETAAMAAAPLLRDPKAGLFTVATSGKVD